MLQLRSIVKDYKAGDTVVHALKGVDISFRKSEFVSILGPSGCGKTTLLNIIGGLDHYTDGELFIDDVSTKNYTARDWDTYRNHRIGFIFQSYNLIPHQTISENVELALNISGVPKAERIRRAHEALDKVGLSGQYNKKPNQLSGGQCQRVAIARALVNDPEILLADEPTGALDTATSVQIMDLIKEISSECLVIMVTHNPELAEKYSTRIIRLLDGEVVSDSDPFDGVIELEESAANNRTAQTIEPEEDAITTNVADTSDTKGTAKPKSAKDKKAKLSFWSAFKLSARNLLSKIKRTLLVCFAGSIGIIGVALVLAVSTGVQNYIADMQDDMLSGNPITISSSALDLAALTETMNGSDMANSVIDSVEDGKINVDKMIEMLVKRGDMVDSVMINNNITEEYVNYVKAMPKDNYSTMNLQYGVNLSHSIYTDYVQDGGTRTMSISGATDIYMSMLALVEDYAKYASYLSMVSSQFRQAPGNPEFILSQYDILSGALPDGSQSHVATEYNEIMIVVSKDTKLTDVMFAQFGFYTQEEFFNEIYRAVNAAKPDDEKNENYDPDIQKDKFDYDELLNKTFTWYPNDTIYTPTGDSFIPFTYSYEADPDWKTGIPLKVTAILRPKADISYGCLSSGFYYTSALTDVILQANRNSKPVTYFETDTIGKYLDGTYPGGAVTINGVSKEMGIQYTYDFDFQGEPYNETKFLGTESSMGMLGAMMGGVSASMRTLTTRELGGASLPGTIQIYPINFDLKDRVTDYLDEWNNAPDRSDEDKVTYTDNLAVVISMVNTMIEIVTAALIAFTALSLVVSTVMIAIITYVSVIERIKEIGVIRSLGGRTHDVSMLFNAETFIIGAISGVIGIGVTYALSGILNLILGTLFGVYTIAALPYYYALMMIAISIVLTLISGLIPASIAAKKDPVDALRTE